MQYPLSEVSPCLDMGPASCPCQEDLCWPHMNSVPAPTSALLAGLQFTTRGGRPPPLQSAPSLASWALQHTAVVPNQCMGTYFSFTWDPELASLFPYEFIIQNWTAPLPYLGLLSEIFHCQMHQNKEKAVFVSLWVPRVKTAPLALQLTCTKGNTATSWRTLPDECSDGTSPCGTAPGTAEEQRGIFWHENVSCYSFIMACS